MSNLFKSPIPKSPLIPTLDKARASIDAMGRARKLRGRAATMLTRGQQQSPTAQRATTGN